MFIQVAPPNLLLLSTYGKVVSIGLLIKVLNEALGGMVSFFSPLLTGIAVMTMFLGSLSALNQINLRKIFAHSTLSNMGYLLADFYHKAESTNIVLSLYAGVYVLGNYVFTCLLPIKNKLNDAWSLGSLQCQSHQLTNFLWLGCAVFLLAGLPPFPLFFSKLSLLYVLIQDSKWILVASISLSSVISCYYYLKIILHLLHSP